MTCYTMTIGKLAKASGIGVDTIRYYEQLGLLEPPHRTPANYRMYGDAAVERLGFIQRAKGLGFTLDEISRLLSLQNGGSRADVKALASEHLADIEARITALQSMRKTLAEAVTCCSGTGPVDGCPIIETLSGKQP